MNLCRSLRLIAVALLVVVPGLRLAADLNRELDGASARNFALDMMHQNAREAAEREEARAARLAAAKGSSLSAANFDLNNDGRLDDREFAAWTAEVRKAVVKSPATLKRFDLSKDGKLDDAEWAAAVDELFGAR